MSSWELLQFAAAIQIVVNVFGGLAAWPGMIKKAFFPKLKAVKTESTDQSVDKAEMTSPTKPKKSNKVD